MREEQDLAIVRSRFEPRGASARLWRQRRRAAVAGDRITASLFLAALADVAQQRGERRRAVRLARALVSEAREVWTLHKLGDAEASAGMYAAAMKSYSSAAALAKEKRDRAQAKAIRQKLRLLSAHTAVAVPEQLREHAFRASTNTGPVKHLAVIVASLVLRDRGRARRTAAW